MNLSVIILAAGKGVRMRSTLPKVLHPLADRPMLTHILDTVQQLPLDKIIVVHGYQGEQLQQAHADYPAKLTWVKQENPQGTGHAAQQTVSELPDSGKILILVGDIPLISKESLKRFIDLTPKNALGVMTAYFNNPAGFGRIIRNEQGEVIAIVEEKDASLDQKRIQEINTGIFLVSAQHLKKWLPNLQNNNAQCEYYLTDILKMAVEEKIQIHTIQPQNTFEVMGVNDKAQLAYLERCYQVEQAKQLMAQGVHLFDPNRFDVRGTIQVGQDVSIDVNVVCEGNVVLGNGVKIGANCVIKDAHIGDHSVIEPNSVIAGAVIETRCVVGPFARIRPGTTLRSASKVGNFVEVKNTVLGQHSKASHLSYLGDAEIGEHVNIGAGTITCNYDGVNKHQTIIEDNVIIGSDTQLIAPVIVKQGATIAAGTTLTKEAPAYALSLSKREQISIPGWKRPTKQEEN